MTSAIVATATASEAIRAISRLGESVPVLVAVLVAVILLVAIGLLTFWKATAILAATLTANAIAERDSRNQTHASLAATLREIGNSCHDHATKREEALRAALEASNLATSRMIEMLSNELRETRQALGMTEQLVLTIQRQLERAENRREG